MRKDPTKPDRRVAAKLPAIAFTTLAAIGLAACGESKSPSAPSAAVPAATAPQAESAGSNVPTTTTSVESVANYHLINPNVTAIPGLLGLVGNAVGADPSELQVGNRPLSGGDLVNVEIAPQLEGTALAANAVTVEIGPDKGPSDFNHWYGIAKANSEPATAKIASDVNGHPAVWSEDHLLLTDIGGNLLQVAVTGQDANGLDLSTNESYAGQIASLVETNAFTKASSQPI